MSPAPNRRSLPFAATIVVVMAVVVAYWWHCASRAARATELAGTKMRLYEAEAATLLDVVMASQAALEADLAVPLRREHAALAAHLRRMGKLRMDAELSFASQGASRRIWESASHYELARRQLENAAGKAEADRIDKEFEFPLRDQIDDLPAIQREL